MERSPNGSRTSVRLDDHQKQRVIVVGIQVRQRRATECVHDARNRVAVPDDENRVSTRFGANGGRHGADVLVDAPPDRYEDGAREQPAAAREARTIKTEPRRASEKMRFDGCVSAVWLILPDYFQELF